MRVPSRSRKTARLDMCSLNLRSNDDYSFIEYAITPCPGIYLDMLSGHGASDGYSAATPTVATIRNPPLDSSSNRNPQVQTSDFGKRSPH